MSSDVAGTVSLKQSVAEEIRALLGRRNMSKLELARRIDRSHTYMWRRLNGETAFDLDDLQLIAAVLGVSAADLLPTKARRATGEEVDKLDPLAPRVIATIGEPHERRAVLIPRQASTGRRQDHPRLADRDCHQHRPVTSVARPVRNLTQ